MNDSAVFDCMVYLQAAARPFGPSGKCLELALTARIELWISNPILEEVRDVLCRDRLRRKFPALTDAAVNALLHNVQSIASRLDQIPHVVEVRDPKDEKYADLAVAANAKYLVTRDNDLLDLMKDTRFCNKYPDILVLDPVAFLDSFDRSISERSATKEIANDDNSSLH